MTRTQAGNLLSARRAARGWSLRDAEEETGISKDTIKALERGAGTVSKLHTYARKLGVKITLE